MANITPECAEAFWRRWEEKYRVARVRSLEVTPAAGSGDNYTSEASRVKVIAVTGEGNEKRTSFILKRAPVTAAKLEFVSFLNLFPREIKMYQEVLPTMERLWRNSNLTWDTLWPDCLYARPYDTLALEDLSQSGYTMADRRAMLDLDHSLLVFKALARIHASSVVLNAHKMLDVESLSKFVFQEPHPTMVKLFNNSVVTVAAQMKTWGSHWLKMSNELSAIADSLLSKYATMCNRELASFCVLNHGDPWTNNFLFKTSSLTGRLVNMKFIDFQISHWNSYAIDLQYTLNTSVQPKVREDHKETLLRGYWGTLVDTFRKLSYEPPNLPTFEDVEKEMTRLDFFGATIGVIMLPIMLSEASDSIDLEDMAANPDTKLPDNSIKSTRLQETLQSSLKPFLGTDLFSKHL